VSRVVPVDAKGGSAIYKPFDVLEHPAFRSQCTTGGRQDHIALRFVALDAVPDPVGHLVPLGAYDDPKNHEKLGLKISPRDQYLSDMPGMSDDNGLLLLGSSSAQDERL
jgi:hypothetical protein